MSKRFCNYTKIQNFNYKRLNDNTKFSMQFKGKPQFEKLIKQ